MTDPSPDLHEALTTAPTLLAEIRANLTPTRTSDGTPGTPGHHRSAPLALHAVDTADNIYAPLIEHAEAIADIINMRPPTFRAVRATTGRPIGLPAGTGPNEAKTLGIRLCRYIEHHLPHVDDPELVNDIATDIIQRVNQADQRYPRDPKPEQIPARCTACECLDVHKHPPRQPGAPETFRCRSCGHTLTEGEAMRQCEARERELKARRRGGGAA